MALFAPGTVAGTLEQIVALAERAVDGCDAAGVLTIDAAGVPATAAWSNDLAGEIDRLQIEAADGPCLDAARSGTTF